jgi:putative ATP-dependent endonuclease of the OLD family
VSEYVQVFHNLKTLEHDIVVSGNRENVEKALRIAIDLSDTITQPKVNEAIACSDLSSFSKGVLQVIDGAKGAFAQALAEVISEDGASFQIPSYISEAFDFLLAPDEDDKKP